MEEQGLPADLDEFWLVLGPVSQPQGAAFGQGVLRRLDSAYERREERLFGSVQVIYYAKKPVVSRLLDR